MMKISGICCSSDIFRNKVCLQFTESSFPCPGGAVLPGAGALKFGHMLCWQASTLLKRVRPLRRSRARFPFLSPAVTSSPGAGEVFPQRESQAVKFSPKVLGAKRNFPAVDLALPLGELAKPQALTERASHFPFILPFYTFSPRFGGKIMSRLK